MLHIRERPRQPPVLERALARYWRDHGASLPPLACDDGSRLRVLYPGRASAAAGPDFRDAVLQREDGRVLRGDVELHLRRAGWAAHGHQTDRGYNGVVLHVVLHGDGAPVTLASGQRVPTAALFPRTLGGLARRDAGGASASAAVAATEALAAASPSPSQAPGSATPRPLPLAALPASTARLARTLDREGDARFFQKVRGYAQALRPPRAGAPRPDPAEVLYRGLLGGLGYGGNSAAMTQLAEGLPLRALERALQGADAGERRAALARALLQAAGLAPAEDAAGQDAPPVVPPDAWVRFRVRPANHPSRRLQGLAVLLDRAWASGLPAWAAALVRAGATAVRAGLTAKAPEGGGALIGPARAADLAVNVLLPYVRAWANTQQDGALAASALALYRAWPPLQENAVTAEALRLLCGDDPSGARALRCGARRQQGLVRIYRRRLAGAEG